MDTARPPTGGWPLPEPAAFADAWRATIQADPLLARWGRLARTGFRFQSGAAPLDVTFGAAPAAPDFTLSAPPATWAKALAPMPPRHHHNLFAMRARVPELTLAGEELAFIQHARLARRVLEIGRWVATHGPGPVPEIINPTAPELPPAEITGRYVSIPLGGVPHRVFLEQSGEGRDLLCLHTAGSDGRQFHRLMADRATTAGWRLTAFDLPWHGRSPPPSPATGALAAGAWRLDTDRYVAIIMDVIRAAGLTRPVVLGASMSGEICLELALRHPEAFSAIIACEACDNIQNRRTPWVDHPLVDQAVFVPEWIHGLSAPQSPAACVSDIWWHYSQGGHATFARDIDFYAGEWDARDRVHRIDTRLCPLFMLTGEYDYSCTMEASAATAAKIPGARFQPMLGLGHFPFAENPRLLAEYLRPILQEIK